MSKFRDRFLPRKVSKHELRYRNVHVEVLEAFNNYLKLTLHKDLPLNWFDFTVDYRESFVEKHGDYAIRVFNVIRKQITQSKD